MDIFGFLLEGFAVSLEPLALTMIVLGCAAGLVIGALPGLGSVNGVAILLPVTFLVPPTEAMMFLMAIYYGAMYGGSISSIMLGIPGASTAVATTFDGRPLAMQGKADRALIAAGVGSFVGGTISIVLFTLFAPPLALFALKFGPHESFALMVMAFATFVGLSGDDIPKTIFSICIGLVLSAVGLDHVSGMPRLIFFDLSGFYAGIGFLVLAIGIYGIGEILWTIEISKGKVEMLQATISARRLFDNVNRLKNTLGTMLMGSILGYFVGMLPAAGATPASLMSYGFAKSLARDPDKFGKGEVRGVIAPETANNAASTGALLPMLTLGIPGSPTTAILLGGMIIWGLTPGPLLFINDREFVWGLISSLYTANLVTVLLMLSCIPLFIWVLRLPFTILAPIIFMLCVVGGFAPTQVMHDVWMMFIFGVGAYLLRKLDYPMAPAVLAIVLGPIAEKTFRQAMITSQGDATSFFTRPLSATFMAVALLLFIYPMLQRAWAQRARSRAAAQGANPGEESDKPHQKA